MKKLLILSFSVFTLISCEPQREVKEELNITVVDSRRDQSTDLAPIILSEFEDEKEGITLTDKQLAEIRTFRPYVQDIVWYFYVYPERLKMDGCCKISSPRFSLWISNGYKHFAIDSPGGLQMNETEKAYVWRLFKSWRDKRVRLYDWDNKNLSTNN